MSDKTPAGSARITKTKRVEHVVTAGEIEGVFHALVDVVWDTPFSDLNYTATCDVEVVSSAQDLTNFFVTAFSRTVDKLTVCVEVSGNVSPGDVVMVHAHAIRD